MNHEKQRSREKEKARERDREKEKTRDREKDRLRDKDRERDRDRDRERDRERDRDEKEREWEEKERDWSRDRERDRDERDRDRERERDREFDAKHKDKDKDEKKKERGKDRGKDADIRRDADLPKERRKDKEKRDRDVEKEKEKEKDRDKEREKEKGREQERDLEKERDREKEKEKEKDYEKDRERRKDRDKDSRHERDKEQERQKEQEKSLDLEVEHLAKEVDKGAAQQSRKGKGDSVSETAAWVSKSRNLEEQKKIEERIKAARMARLLSEQDSGEESEEDEKTPAYVGKDLAGLKVLHGIDKVMEGGTVVLTLKDRGILDKDDVNNEVDELENLEISQQMNRDKAYRDAKKKPGIYEDKFQNDINAERTILPQYDEEMEDGMTLDETGGLNEEGRKRLDELRKKLQGVDPKAYQSLSGSGNIASDFYSQEEMLQFKKPKKKKKLRKKQVLDLDAMEAEAKAEGLGDADLGSRSSGAKQAQKLEKEKAAEESRKSAYLNAYTKAVDASQKLRVGSATDSEGKDVVIFGVEDDDELERSLQRARQAALKKQAENGGSSSGPQAVASALQQASEMEIEMGNRDDAGDRDKTALVFTETEEFCRNIQLDEILQRRPGTKDVFAEDDEPMEDEKPHGLDGGWMEVNEYNKAEKTVEKQAEEDPGVEEVVVEVAVGKGLSGALQLLKERGTLKETVEWGGRNMDKKKSKLVGLLDQEEKFKNKEILLERVDEFGRVMTPKEAFRKLSHKFHGKGPGKMKQEKRMKQFEEELKLKQMTSGDTPLLSMQKMREAQEKLQTPYLVISGHTQPGHTSDAGSSFGSLDKGSIGSLTPMLGDQKVEHFLGIKRRPEGGSMRPPLPKKPKTDK